MKQHSQPKAKSCLDVTLGTAVLLTASMPAVYAADNSSGATLYQFAMMDEDMGGITGGKLGKRHAAGQTHVGCGSVPGHAGTDHQPVPDGQFDGPHALTFDRRYEWHVGSLGSARVFRCIAFVSCRGNRIFSRLTRAHHS